MEVLREDLQGRCRSKRGAQQCPQIYAFKKLLYTLKIMPLDWQQNKSHQVPEGICQRQDLGGQTTSTATCGLARRPPFAP